MFNTQHTPSDSLGITYWDCVRTYTFSEFVAACSVLLLSYNNDNVGLFTASVIYFLLFIITKYLLNTTGG